MRGFKIPQVQEAFLTPSRHGRGCQSALGNPLVLVNQKAGQVNGLRPALLAFRVSTSFYKYRVKTLLYAPNGISFLGFGSQISSRLFGF